MNNKGIAILVSITLVVIIATIVAVNQRSKSVSNDPSNQYLFSDLKKNINDVAQIDIVSGKEQVSIKLHNNEWQVSEKNNYTADLAKVKDSIFGIANMTKVEAKTKKAENYSKLGVEDPKQENATSKLVILSNVKGDKLTEVIIGNTRPGTDSQFVRPANDPQAWLVSPNLTVDPLAINWLDKKLIHISKDRIKKLAITQVDGKQLVITKESADSGDHSVKDFPKGKTLKGRFEPRTIATALENFSLQDVISKDAIDFESAPVVKAEYQTFDGLIINALVLEKEGLHYARFSASSEPVVAVSEAVVSEPVASESVASSSEKVETNTTKAKEEAKSLNEKFHPWIYIISKDKFDLMTKKMTDLIKVEEKKSAHAPH
jgi:hypothetical protein